MREIELKFIVEPSRAPAIEAALRRLPSASRRTIESRYHDTPDRRLAAAGLALRLRRIGRAWEQTLKASGDSALDRDEETVARPGRWGAVGPPIDTGLHRGSRAGSRLTTALKRTGATSLGPGLICTTRFSRRSVEIEAEGARVEVAFDRGVIEAAGATLPICEIEYELKAGDPGALARLGRAGVLEHGLCLSTLTKFERGERLARGLEQGSAARFAAPRLDAAMTDVAIERAIARSCLDHVLANASAIACGRFAAECVHQLRVGLRRLRTAARELDVLRGIPDSEWEIRLSAAFRALGAYRDRESVAAALRERLAAAGSPGPMLAFRADDVADPVGIVRDPRFQCALLDILVCTLGAPGAGGAVRAAAAAAAEGGAATAGADVPTEAERGAAPRATLRRARERLHRLHAELEPRAKDFETLEPAAQHRVRKRLKRLRYLAELVGPLFERRKVKRYLDRLRPAQDALGEHTDLLVGIGLARSAADRGAAQAWFNVGWLTAEGGASARRSARALARAAAARPFWKARPRGRR